MAGSSSNWFKPSSGKLKGSAVYLSRAQQQQIAPGAATAAARRLQVEHALDGVALSRATSDMARRLANTQRPAGAARPGQAPLRPGTPVYDAKFRYRPRTPGQIAAKQDERASSRMGDLVSTVSRRNPVDMRMPDGTTKPVVQVLRPRYGTRDFEVRFGDGTSEMVGPVDMARRIARNAARQAPTERRLISRLSGVKPAELPSEAMDALTRTATPHMAGGRRLGEEVERVRQVGDTTLVQTYVRPLRMFATYQAATGAGGRLTGLRLTGGVDRDTDEPLTAADVQARIARSRI